MSLDRLTRLLRSFSFRECTLVDSLETRPTAELYHRKADRYELNNLVDEHPKIGKDMEFELCRFVEPLY